LAHLSVNSLTAQKRVRDNAPARFFRAIPRKLKMVQQNCERCYRDICALVFCFLAFLAPERCGAATNELKFVPPCRALGAAARANHIPQPGFDAPVETKALDPGDSATILVTQFEKGGHHNQWLIYLEVVPPTERERASKPPPPKSIYTSFGNKLEFASARTFVKVRTLGPFVESEPNRQPPPVEDESARIALDTGFLGLGFARAAAAEYRVNQLRSDRKFQGSFGAGESPFSKTQVAAVREFAAAYHVTPAEERALGGMSPALQGYFGLAEETPVLNKILFKVFDAPSAWSLLRTGRLPSVAIEAGLATPNDPRDWRLPPGSPVYSFPWTVAIDGHPALELGAIVTAPRPPFLLTGGVVSLLVTNPNDKDKYLTLYVIGARHGGGAANKVAEPPASAAEPPAAESAPETSSPCNRIVMIGASVTHGFTASELFGGTNTARYDLARYLDAALQVPHSSISNLGNSFFFMLADSSGEQQIKQALEAKPTLVVGIDFLFWFCYGKGFDEAGRLQHFEKGLELLEAIPCPLVIGDLPDASAAVNGMLSADEMPSAETLAAANRRLKEWVAKRPRVLVVPLSKFMTTVMADQPLATHGFVLPDGQTRALIQDDKLHPTARGCATLALTILDALQSSQSALADSAFYWDAEQVLHRALETLRKEQASAVQKEDP
jgi:hypothetical protein